MSKNINNKCYNGDCFDKYIIRSLILVYIDLICFWILARHLYIKSEENRESKQLCVCACVLRWRPEKARVRRWFTHYLPGIIMSEPFSHQHKDALGPSRSLLQTNSQRPTYITKLPLQTMLTKKRCWGSSQIRVLMHHPSPLVQKTFRKGKYQIGNRKGDYLVFWTAVACLCFFFSRMATLVKRGLQKTLIFR